MQTVTARECVLIVFQRPLKLLVAVFILGTKIGFCVC